MLFISLVEISPKGPIVDGRAKEIPHNLHIGNKIRGRVDNTCMPNTTCSTSGLTYVVVVFTTPDTALCCVVQVRNPVLQHDQEQRLCLEPSKQSLK